MIHIRVITGKKRGNYFYKDNRILNSTTLCGAPCGDKDVVDTKDGLEWLRSHSGCPICADRAKWANR